MLKPFSLLFFVAVMAWFGAIFLPSDPQVRMDRTCIPVSYIDKGATAAMQLVDAGWGEGTHEFFENIHYGCRFVVWRVFYEDAWNRANAQGREGTAPAAAPSGGASAAKPAQRHIKSE